MKTSPTIRHPLPSWLRLLVQHYPVRWGKGYLAHRLLTNDKLPSGYIVESKDGIVVRIYPDWMYKWLYLYGEYEPETTAVFKRIIRSNDVCFDVGANYGFFTSLFAKLGAHVYAFEPLPNNFLLHSETMNLNDLQDQVHAYNFGLGANSGEFTLFTFAGLPHGQASATDLGRQDATPHVCRITTLDNFCANHRVHHIDFMKVDIEGHELECFKGGRQMLSQKEAPILHFEVNEQCMRDRQLDPNRLIELLKEYGYTKFWKISRQGNLHPLSRTLSAENADYVATKPFNEDRVKG